MQRGLWVMGDVKDKAEERQSTCYLQWCVFCWGLSPSLLCNRRERSAWQGVSTHMQTFTHTAHMNWSLNMPNKSTHNKLPTIHWREIHPLDAPQWARSYRTNCAVCLCNGQTHKAYYHCLSYLTLIYQMALQLARLWWCAGENISRQKLDNPLV